MALSDSLRGLAASGAGAGTVIKPAVGANAVSGIAAPYAAVPVYKGSSATPIGTAFADASGNWTLTLGTAAALGDIYRTPGSGAIVGVVLNALTVSVSTATVGVAFSATIGGLTAGSTPSLTGAGAAGLSVSGSAISGTPTTAGAVNIVETSANGTNSPRTTSAVIAVSAAGAGPTLGALSISPNTAMIGTPYTGTISGATAGSTIVLDSLTVTGTGTTRSVTGTPQGSAGSWPATETLSGATNSPNTTNNVLTVAAAVTGPVLRLIVWGQSNAQALGTATTANGGFNAAQVMPTGYTGPDSRVKIWGTSNTFETYQPYVNSEQGSFAGTTWGSEWGAASKWLADNPTGTVYIVKHPIGSTGLAVGSSSNVWAPSAGQLYTALTNKVTAARTALTAQGVTVNAANTVVIQSQGEQDARTSTDAGNYQTNLTNFISTARTDWVASRWIIERLHVEMTLSGFTPGWATVYAAQGAVVAADQNIDIVSTDGLALGDNLHFTVASCDIKGLRTGDVMQKWWTKAPFAGLAAIADVTGDRCAIPFVAGDLTTMKSCRLSDVLAVNTTATTARTYIDATGALRSDLAANVLRLNYSPGRRELRADGQVQNAALYSHDLTQAATWVASGITPALDQTGIEFTNPTNAASSLTATTANATILQSITATSALRFFSAYLKRITGTGAVQMTQDGGTTWTTVAVTGAWARFSIPSQTLANPQVGFRLAVSGDAVAVEFCQSETNIVTPPIKTTTTAVTRASENLNLSSAALNLFQGTAGTLVVRGTGPTQTAATFATGDVSNEHLLSRSTGGQLQSITAGGTLSANAGSGGFTTPFGVALGYSAAGRRICLNGGTVASDAVAVAAHTAVQLLRNPGASSASYPNCGIDFLAVGPSLLADSQLQALAAANY